MKVLKLGLFCKKNKSVSSEYCFLDGALFHVITCFLFWGHTFDEFVVSCDVLQSWETNSFSADEGSNSLSVFANAEHLTLVHDDCVHISVDLSIDKWDVIKQVDKLTLDRFDGCWATAEHSYDD